MGEREWKPGDVAMVTTGVYQGRIGILAASAGESDRVLGVAFPDYEEPGGIGVLAYGVSTLRPLVVIDPEDGEAVERLVTLYCNQFPIARGPEDDEAMAAALREFADPKPPKPDEPTGLGAVVEDESGELWIRTCEPCDRCLNKPWQQGPVHKNWQIVDAVRVLSEGVTP